MKIKKPGRPKGSKNRKYVAAVQFPATCPTCGSDELKAVEGAPARLHEIAGNYNGFDYVGIRYQNCRCECGQFVIVRTYIPQTKKPAG